MDTFDYQAYLRNNPLLENLDEGSEDFKTLNLNKWWEHPPETVMSYVYWRQDQIPPTNQEAWDRQWDSISSQLEKKFPKSLNESEGDVKAEWSELSPEKKIKLLKIQWPEKSDDEIKAQLKDNFEDLDSGAKQSMRMDDLNEGDTDPVQNSHNEYAKSKDEEKYNSDEYVEAQKNMNEGESTPIIKQHVKELMHYFENNTDELQDYVDFIKALEIVKTQVGHEFTTQNAKHGGEKRLDFGGENPEWLKQNSKRDGVNF